MASGLLEGVLGRIADEAQKTRPLLPLYLHLILSSIFPIFIAAHAALRRPSSAAPAKKQKKSSKLSDQDSEAEEESSSPIETLTTSDAILFPILAGLTLTGLYVIIKWLEDPSLLNKILGYYFNWIGTFFTFKLIKDVLYFVRSVVFPTQFSHNGVVYKHSGSAGGRFNTAGRDDIVGDISNRKDVSTTGLFGRLSRASPFLRKARQRLYYKATCTISLRKPFGPDKSSFSITLLDVVAGLTSLLLSVAATLRGKVPWYLTNLSGFAFCYGSLQFMTPGTSATGYLLLSLLFFYDIYMVFYTPMMVTVATKLEVPIKLLFPRPDDGTCTKPMGALPGSDAMEEYLKCLAKKRTMAMLGLGDIVVPGIMIAFALRFDLYRWYLQMGKDGKDDGAEESKEGRGDNNKDTRPTYIPARGMWAERFYTARDLWSPALKAKDFPKPYFKATMVGYVLGMVATLLVMQIWQHAQPALLYLVPGVLISFGAMALWKGEVKLLWNYDEAEEDKQKENKQAEDKKAREEAKSKGEESGNGKGTERKESMKSSKTSRRDGEKMKRDQPAFSFDIYLPATGEPTEEVKSTLTDEAQPITPDDHDNNRESSTSSSNSSSSVSSSPEIVSKEDVAESGEDHHCVDWTG
ncbi:hypothetical protein LTR70_008199 [Exophiala xenobiotica]|uniref:Signal peptide peptidase n=1 Tax=Lithohypha guttulata TaxID=1690604 RepID=A0ABR0K1W6_9EURO|nr:hypothetical protein LTR24_007957 [Lithohypha guttulata]KAK5312429.1 hypothetical protein LTR70_008199 [Exophiala xenobiotica]